MCYNQLINEINKEDNMDILDIMQQNKAYAMKHKDEPSHLQIPAKELCWEYNQTRPSEQQKRKEILNKLLGTYHPMVFIQPSFQCDYGFNIHMQGLAIINHNCVILDTSPVIIGANAFIGPGTCLSCVGHAIDPYERSVEGIITSAPITLEEDVWIGANVTVCGGVTIGKGSIIGAGSVVTKDIPQGVVAAGSPCKVIRPITQADRLNL